MEQTKTAIIRPIAPAGEYSFEELFKTHFRGLHAYAFTIVKDSATAEEIVQNMFCRIWEKKEQLSIQTSVKAYLYKAVYHDSLNHLKHRQVRLAYVQQATKQPEQTVQNTSDKVMTGELSERIRKAMNELPEQCRTIFQLSRFEGMKYQEIANAMGLSVKTIENQMGKALKLMRLKLAEFMPVILLWLSLVLVVQKTDSKPPPGRQQPLTTAIRSFYHHQNL